MAIPWAATGFVGAATKTDLFLTTLALAAALLLAAVIIKLVDRWRKRQSDDDVVSSEDQLAHFQQLHWRGELSKEEFERIQSLLGERMRQEQAQANPAAPPPSEGPPRPPDPPETGIRPQPPG